MINYALVISIWGFDNTITIYEAQIKFKSRSFKSDLAVSETTLNLQWNVSVSIVEQTGHQSGIAGELNAQGAQGNTRPTAASGRSITHFVFTHTRKKQTVRAGKKQTRHMSFIP